MPAVRVVAEAQARDRAQRASGSALSLGHRLAEALFGLSGPTASASTALDARGAGSDAVDLAPFVGVFMLAWLFRVDASAFVHVSPASAAGWSARVVDSAVDVATAAWASAGGALDAGSVPSLALRAASGGAAAAAAAVIAAQCEA